MKQIFKKMMREQIQAGLNNLAELANKPAPKGGWIYTIRHALGMSGTQLAKRLGCTQSNITALERREKAGTISLQSLEQAADAMNCRLVYFFIPNKPLDQLREDQARLIAKKRMRAINHSMALEQQSLTQAQKQQQEDELAHELMYHDNAKHLWDADEDDKHDV